jgi:long-chain acyl-CoA synthetase
MFYSRFVEAAERWPNLVAVEIQRQADPSPSSARSGSASGAFLESYTYAQLRDMAESVGAWLIDSRVTGGQRAAILASNSPRWVAAYLGIVASGNTAVPLDTAFRPDQIAKLLLDCGASLLFVDDRHRELAEEATAGSQVQIVLIEGADPKLPNLDQIFKVGRGNFSPATVASDDVACILYTSGTTSDPKGVMLSHANLRGEIDSVFKFIDIGPTDALLGVLPLFHALAQMANIMLPFAGGARVVFLDSLNTTELMKALAERDITVFACVPQFFYLIHERIFKQVAERGRMAQAAFTFLLKFSRASRLIGLNPGKKFFRKVHDALGPKMRYFVTGGSKFDASVGRDLHALGFDILQAYGLTECSGGAVCTPPAHNVIGSVGQPLPGVEVKIIDPQPQEHATGATVGEVTIRGAIVMKGYYNRPDATAATLKDGWLLTGDYGYLDPRGNLFITGRKKEVIVLSSGKNIYPEEIEDYYLKSPWIKEVCVVGLESRPGEPLGERLHGVVVPNFDVLRQKKIVNTREVIRYDIENISAHLAPTKRILSYEIWQEDLPRTTTRKLKRFEIERKVKERQAAGLSEDAEPQVARKLSDEEREWLQQPEVSTALEVIRRASKDPAVQIHPKDNLELDLGLDSMERVELLVELEHKLGAEVEESAASEVYTVRELVDLIRANIGKTGAQSAGWETILAGEVTDPMVLSLRKTRRVIPALWYLCGKATTLFTQDAFHLRIKGLENFDKIPEGQPFIICPNHQSFLDAPIVTAAMPWRVFKDLFYVGTSEIFGGGVWKLFARFLRLIPVDPDANLVPAMRAGAFGLRSGRILMLYPEGERSIDGKPRAFKKGAAILARHLNVPIVPMALEGFFEAWPRGQGFKGFSHLRMAIGEPIFPNPAEPPEVAYDRITTELRNRVLSMWNEMHKAHEAEEENAVPVEQI